VFVASRRRQLPALQDGMQTAWVPVTNLDSYVLSTTARKALSAASVLAV
jgi:hypothetical protein